MSGNEVRTLLAKNIKSLRGRRNWSQADLAEKTGLSVVYLSDIERGNKWPYLDTLVALSGAFKVDVYELLKPEQPNASGAVFARYADEAEAIVTSLLQAAEKHARQSLDNLRDAYAPPERRHGGFFRR